MASRFQFRRGTAAEWTAANPVLAEGEIGVELDTQFYKIGNGVTPWNSRPYASLRSVDSATAINYTAIADPAAPAAGQMTSYAKSISGRMLPKIVGPSGLDTALQPALFGNGIRILSPGISTTFTQLGMAAPAVVGTLSHPVPAAGTLRTQTRRGNVISAATANAAAELRNSTVECWRGNTPGQGGFFLTTRFAIASATALQRSAFGLFSTTTAISTTQSPSSLTNAFFMGNDSGDTNMQIMHNDGAGTCTKINLGADFPVANTAAVYEVIFFAAPNASNISWRAQRFDVPAVAEGVISTDMPDPATFLAWHAYMNNGGTAAAVAFDLMRYYLETDY
jgi:Major tropism determinant N-terminal domain